MHLITLDCETDFDGWRKAARAFVLNDVRPADITWTVRGSEPELFAAETSPLPDVPEGTFNVPAKFVELARSAILHRDEERFAILYRLLWRLRGNHDLLAVATDPDVALVSQMTRAVHRDEHKMHAFVRFREVGRDPKSHYVAWFEPEHHIVELAAPFFARRFADMPWSILTPDLSAHWDGHALSFTPGVDKAEAPTEDRLEETWRRYYASIFNPARLKVKAMEKEMPKRYWRNLPEASLIKPLIADAARTSDAMIATVPTEPHKPQKRQDTPMPRTTAASSESLTALREEAAHCRACPLWKDATQTVFGEGPKHARIMLVGEQPGDKEDLAGLPFVGPAGQMLDRDLLNQELAQAPAPVRRCHVEPLHLAGAVAEVSQCHAPGGDAPLHRQDQAPRGRGVAARQPGDLGVEALEGEGLGDRGGELFGIGTEQVLDESKRRFVVCLPHPDRPVARIHRPWPPAERSPAIPSMLARFF